MGNRPLFAAIPLTVLLALSGCAAGSGKPAPILSTVPTGRVGWIGSMPVLFLRGTPYDIGYQHGTLMRSEVRSSVRNILAYADRRLGVPGIGRWLVRRKLDRAWGQMNPFVPDRYLEEMRGLADGAEIPLKTIHRVHAIPDLTSVTCASSVLAGGATRDGRLIHIRNLDWAIRSGVQRYSALIVCEPKGERPFVSVGWLGFVGVISGISRQGISVAEIGAETKDASLKGIPMPFLLRRVLEESDDLKQAAKIVQEAPRTGGYNYLFADAQDRSAVALETTHRHAALFWMEKGRPLVRSDYALDPGVRDLQIACNGDPSRPGPESPKGSGGYDLRYRGQQALLERFIRKVDPEVAMAIARAIAPDSNIQSVVYAYPQLWVATARGRRPAAAGSYREVDLEELFGL